MKRRQFAIGIYIMIICFALPCDAQNIQPTEALDRLIKLHFPAFNGSILISKSNQCTLHSYGYTDFDSSQVITAASRFNIGSLSKEFPAIVILDLLLSRQLNMADTIGEFIEGLPNSLESITIEELLFYASGLPKLDFKTIQSDVQARKSLPSITLEFEPGTDFLYSNWNNLLLVFIIEKILKSDYRTVMKANYFKPLDINDSFFDNSKSSVSQNMTKSFSSYYGNDETGSPIFKKFEFSYAPLYMTIGDVYKWITYIQARYDHINQLVRDFFRPRTVEKLGPLGIIENAKNKGLVHRHAGQAYSYSVFTYRNYDSGVTIIIMTNNNQSIQILELEDRILQEINTF